MTLARNLGLLASDVTVAGKIATSSITGLAASATTDTTNASNITTGTLPVSIGGTGANSLTSNSLLVGNGTSAVNLIAPGTSGNVLVSSGTTWLSQALSGLKIKSVNQVLSSTTYTGSNADYTTITSVSVTPQSTGSKFFIFGSTTLTCVPGSNNGAILRILRNGTSIYTGKNGHNLNNTFVAHFSPILVDSPNTISALTYYMQAIGGDSSTITTSGYHYSLILVEYE